MNVRNMIMQPMFRYTSRIGNHQRGFTLVEVLVALLVLSIGLLGLAALQVTSLAYNTESYLRTQATFFAYDIIDRMRTNPTGLANGNYTVAASTDANTKVTDYTACSGSGQVCSCVTTACTVSNLALYDLGTWYTTIDSVLPGSKNKRATITKTTANLVTITINWDEHDFPLSQVWEVQL